MNWWSLSTALIGLGFLVLAGWSLHSFRRDGMTLHVRASRFLVGILWLVIGLALLYRAVTHEASTTF